MPERRSKLWRDALLTSGGSAASVAISALSSVIIARQLGVSARGISSAVLALSVLCGTLATGGMAGGIAYAFARVAPEHRPPLARAGTTVALLLAGAGGGLFLAAAALHGSPGVTLPEALAAAAVAGSYVLHHVLLNLCLTAASLRWYAVAQFFPASVVLAAICVVALTNGLTIFAVIAISAGGSLIGAGAAYVGLKRYGAYGAGRVHGRWREAFAILRPYAKYSLMIFATTSMTQVVQRLDIVLVADLRSARAAGLYSVASQLGELVLVLPSALAAVVFRGGALAARSHSEDATRVLRWTFAVALTVTIVFALAARVAIELAVGRRYDGAVTPLRLLLPGLAVLSLQTVISGYVVSRGYARMALTAWLTAAIVGVGADVFVIPRYGADGAAVVSSASYLLVLILHLKALRLARESEATGARKVHPRS